MTLLNTQDGYGALTKFFHWFIVGLFAFQFAAANIMLRIDFNESALGLSQATYYNWHKSIGLLALVVVVLRLLARKSGELPAWAPTLTKHERRFVHRAEQLLYTAMFVMPVSGFLYVMAGGYGVNLFGVLDLANPIGKHRVISRRCQVDAYLEQLRSPIGACRPCRPGSPTPSTIEGPPAP